MRSVYISLYYKYSIYQLEGMLRGHTNIAKTPDNLFVLGFYLIPAHCHL